MDKIMEIIGYIAVLLLLVLLAVWIFPSEGVLEPKDNGQECLTKWSWFSFETTEHCYVKTDVRGELVQCEKALEVVREDNYRLNFPERFDRCSRNPYTNQIVCEVCQKGDCIEVHEWYKQND